MRITTITFFSLLLAQSAFVSAETGANLPTTGAASSTGLPKANFVKEFAMGGVRKLIGGSGGSIYLAKKDGSVAAVDKEGRLLLTLQANDRKGKPVLEQPEAIAVAEGTIYVADSETHHVAMFTLEGQYKGSFGGNGSGAGELRTPQGVAVHEGIVYVADSGNKRIQMFGSNGVFLTTLEIDSVPENKASKDLDIPYRLSEPSTIAVDAAGQIYVLDEDDALIKIYAPNGAYKKHLPNSSKALTFSLAADGIYVANQNSLIIQKYNLDHKPAYSFGAKGEGRALFKSITGLVAGKDQQVFVGDSKQNVTHIFLAEEAAPLNPLPKKASRTSVQWQEVIPVALGKIAWNGKDTLYGIDPDGKAISLIRNGSVGGKILVADLAPVAIAVDMSGSLWVLDKKKMRVVKLDDAGNILTSFGSRGNAVGQLNDPTDMVISSSGIIYIADRGNSWVQAFNSEGVFLYVIRNSVAAKLENPYAIALDPQGNLYILDKSRSMVIAYSAKGDPVAEFGKTPEGLAILQKPTALMATHNEVFVLDDNQVKVFSQKGPFIRSFGAEGMEAGELNEPVAIAAKDSTTIFISERGNKRVQTFATLYKPEAPGQLTAQGAIHAVELRWASSALPYIKQYHIYRSGSKSEGFAWIASSQSNQFTDKNLLADEQYYYRVAAQTHYGYEGATSLAVLGTALKYTPPALENVQVEATPFKLKVSWKPLDTPFLKTYLVYQKNGDEVTKIGETTSPEFSKDSLTPATPYTYYISALGTDGIESEKIVVNTATLVFNKEPLDIDVVKLKDVFSGTYKIYEQDGVGRIKLTNNTDKVIEKIKVSFVLKGVMDFPTEGKIDKLLPGQSQEFNLMAVFNNSILDITENSSIQALVEASYFENGQRMVNSKNLTVNVYEKHRLMWAERDRFASFITPKDPPIINFVRSVITQFNEVKDEFQLAAALFDTLGVLGLTYVQDPTNPYQITSGKADFVDYIQYPRETLERKSGDCDDLVALYSAALESIGISTMVVDVPGHMFMMFDTGIKADADGYTMDDMYVIHNDRLWIPVETTIVGSSFVKAWELGASNYYKWKGKGLTLQDAHYSWITYKPATLADSTLKFREVTAADIEKKFPGDATSVLKISSQTKTRGYLRAIAKNPADMESHLQMGIILARLGDRKEAMKYFDKVIATEPKNASALNNRGNLHMMDGKYADAQKAYLAATLASPDDAYVFVNLAKSYKAAKETKKAKAAFIKAQKLDPTMKVKYKALALELLNAL